MKEWMMEKFENEKTQKEKSHKRKNHKKEKATKKKKPQRKKQSFVAFNICACFYKKLNLVRDSCLYRNMVAVAFYYSAARVKRL